jgi:hypothetical protein
MVRVFDQADYDRRLEALQPSNDISLGEEIGLIWEGWKTGEGSGPLEARIAINEAKINALRQARREMIRAIRAEQDKARRGAIIPLDVQELVTGKGDELVKVP